MQHVYQLALDWCTTINAFSAENPILFTWPVPFLSICVQCVAYSLQFVVNGIVVAGTGVLFSGSIAKLPSGRVMRAVDISADIRQFFFVPWHSKKRIFHLIQHLIGNYMC